MLLHLKGAHVPHKKNTANMSAVRMTTPAKVTLPTSMHIGAPATPVVKPGDYVAVGTLVAEQNGFVSSPVYASVSGTVVEVADMLLSNGATAPGITIESDGKMTVSEDVQPPVVNSREDMIDAIKKSGIVGLGGAGFPTYVKFGPNSKIDIQYLVINGAECEPYITSDSVTMVDRADDITYSIQQLCKWFEIENVIIGIEKNKPEAIDAMKKVASQITGSNVQVKVLPALYPQGGEKVLVYHTTGRQIPTGKLPIDVGCVVCNSTTIASIGAFLKTGMPLVEKCVTVDGGSVAEPKNVIAPIGTPLKDVFEFCGGLKSEPGKVIYGGPMMGIAVPNIEAPILKNTNAILAFNEKESRDFKTTACIKCGACINHCPFGINPAAISRAYKEEDTKALEKLGTDLCMLCGCCSFVCPAKQPLVHTNLQAKAMLKNAREKEAK